MSWLAFFFLTRVITYSLMVPDSDFALYLATIKDGWDPHLFGYHTVYKPLIFFWILWVFNRLFSFLPLFLKFRMSTLFFALGQTLAFWAVMRRRFGAETAERAVWLYLAHPLFLFIEAYSFPDLFGSAMAWFAVLLPFPASLLFFIFSMLFKQLPGFFVPLLLFMFDRRKEAVAYALLLPFLMTPWIFWKGLSFNSLQGSLGMAKFFWERLTTEHLQGNITAAILLFVLLTLFYTPAMVLQRPDWRWFLPWLALAVIVGWMPNYIWYVQPLFPALVIWPALNLQDKRIWHLYRAFSVMILVVVMMPLLSIQPRFFAFVDELRGKVLYSPRYVSLLFFSSAYFDAPHELCYGAPGRDSSPIPFTDGNLYKPCSRPPDFVLDRGNFCELLFTFKVCRADAHSPASVSAAFG